MNVRRTAHHAMVVGAGMSQRPYVSLFKPTRLAGFSEHPECFYIPNTNGLSIVKLGVSG